MILCVDIISLYTWCCVCSRCWRGWRVASSPPPQCPWCPPCRRTWDHSVEGVCFSYSLQIDVDIDISFGIIFQLILTALNQSDMQARGCVSQMLRPGPSKDQPPPAAARYQLSVPRLGSSNHRCVEAGRYHHNYAATTATTATTGYTPRLLPATGAATAGHYSGCMEGGGGGIDLMRGGAHPTRPPLQLQGTMRKFVIIFLLNFIR